MKKKLFTLLFALVAIATTAGAQNSINGHEYVDLGLPSGTLWATCNVGANSPEEFGSRFAWGETEPKDEYSWNTYKWCITNGSSKSYTKYNTGHLGGIVDYKTELDLEDDAAYVKWGEGWRTPSLEQINELTDNCTWEWDGTAGESGGYKITGTNGNFIFIPKSYKGDYWSRSLNTPNQEYCAYKLLINSYNYGYNGTYHRCSGYAVRPVSIKDQSTGIFLNVENFPDANFRAALAEKFKINEGEEITRMMLVFATSLDIGNKSISDLTGIEHFTMLKELYCYKNPITSLNVSKLTNLTILHCGYTQLTSLDLSQNTMLKTLVCWGNEECKLTSLNVTGCTKLEELYCSDNNLTSLDISECEALTKIECDANQLAVLDFSKNPVLTELSCSGNQLITLDISSCFLLKKMRCAGNLLTFLDVSKNPMLYSLDCGGNQIESLYIANNAALRELYCSKNKLISLDISKNLALTTLYCGNNQLKSLDVSKNTALEKLYCQNNRLTTLDLSNLNLKNPPSHYQYFTAKAVLLDDGRVGIDLGVENLNFSRVKELKADRAEIDAVVSGQFLIIAEKMYECPSIVEYKYDTKSNYGENMMTVYITIDAPSGIFLNEENFPDGNFRATLADWFGIDEGDEFQMKDIRTNFLSISQWNTDDVEKITNLSGIEHFAALTKLYCCDNLLTTLDVSLNKVLANLQCHYNLLTALDVSQNTALTLLTCFNNQIKGEAMDALVASLPTVESGEFYVINTKDTNEENVCTKAQVAVAKAKGWTVYDYNGGSIQEYEGSDPVEEDINPVDEDDNIDFGSDMDENSDLDGNVIGDIFYNIGSGNGEYNAEEGCIVLKKTTDDETVDGLSGKDIFGEDFKGQFTGIVFKVPSGKGTVKVTAETTGNMLLKVKIGDGEPVEMELNGKLKISFPYNVSETTLVAIYAGSNNEAKGFGTTNATEDAALKIYGIEFERGESTAIGASLNDNGQRTNDSWYTIDGVKLNGEPMKKGVYIIKGKKVKR